MIGYSLFFFVVVIILYFLGENEFFGFIKNKNEIWIFLFLFNLMELYFYYDLDFCKVVLFSCL